jgi:uncharacterized protein YggE
MNQPGPLKPWPSFLVLLLALLLVVGNPLPAWSAEIPDSSGPILVVTGLGQVDAKPDQAKIVLGVVTSGKVLKDLQEENTRNVTRLIEALTGQGLQRSQIETTGYYAWPQYVYSDRGDKEPPAIAGYQIRNEITVTLYDLKNIGPVVEAALKAGANEVRNITYSLRDDSGLQDRALAQARDNAHAKGAAIVQALGLKLGAVVSVKESSAPAEIYPITLSMAGTDMTKGGSVPVQPGNITVRSTVTISYQVLRP